MAKRIRSKTANSEYKEALRRAGSKATRGRLKVVQVLAKKKKALSIQDLRKELKGRLDQATLYRMMNAMQESGLVRQVNLLHGHAHFELATQKHHHHIICESCGKVVDISKCNIKPLEKQAMQLSKFSKISHHSLELFGLCSACAKKRKA